MNSTDTNRYELFCFNLSVWGNFGISRRRSRVFNGDWYIQLNSVGDPFVAGDFRLNSKVFECAVLDYFAKLWNAPDRDSTTPGEGYWGYVLSMGSTEGNLYALSLLVEFFASRGFPIVVNFNYGATFKGALDDVSGAIDLLLPILEKHGLKDRTLQITLENGKVVKSPRNGYWFHIDGALGAAYGPFLEKARE
ncbi:histidine decarboxylase [Xenorhabdus sp. KK7.4]|nr:histidine decarboxylase [Xenorhabdus sp. KK7.4]